MVMAAFQKSLLSGFCHDFTGNIVAGTAKELEEN